MDGEHYKATDWTDWSPREALQEHVEEPVRRDNGESDDDAEANQKIEWPPDALSYR